MHKKYLYKLDTTTSFNYKNILLRSFLEVNDLVHGEEGRTWGQS